jgi:hypothetical protein
MTDFNVKTNSSFKFSFVYYTDETETTPVVLTGYTVRIGIANLDGTAATGMNNTTNSYATITNASGGVVSVNVPTSVTNQWSEGSLLYDVRLVNGTDAEAVLEGKLFVTKGIAGGA